MVIVHWEEEGEVLPSYFLSKTEYSQSEERLPLKMSALVEFVSKKPLPKHTRHLLVEVMVCDEDGEDVEVNFTSLDPATTLTTKHTC